ncbi:hypothetical protein PEC106568_32150 [Pectobacterium carotovorum subsp. carotovorum]|nr:hypothetical protein PEC106568_32150 [Pectobacterium carotovorum subsp. carotovorum]
MVNKSAYSDLELMQARIKSVPSGWVFSYVGNVFSIKNNLRKPISEEVRAKNVGLYPYFGPTKIQGYIGSYEQDGRYVLIGEDGDHFLKYESQSMTQLVDGKCTVNNHAHIIEGTSKATREWFYYYFMHRDIFSFLSRQGAGRYKLNKASLEKIPLIVPPIGEQKKIAQILSTWDQAITTTEQLLANSQQQKKSLMQQLITGKRRFPGFSGEWNEVYLGDICQPRQWATISSSDLIDNGYPVYGANGFIGYFTEFNHLLETVAVTCRGSTCGEVSLIPEKSYITGNSMCLDEIDTDKNHHIFIFYLLKYRGFNDVISGSAQPQIVGNAIKKIKITVPELEEQNQIASVLTIADQETETLKQKLNHLKQEKKALMQQLLTGRRRVKTEAA